MSLWMLMQMNQEVLSAVESTGKSKVTKLGNIYVAMDFLVQLDHIYLGAHWM